MMDDLVKFIESNPDSKKLKRALTVQMDLKSCFYRQIAEVLSVSDSFANKWWLVFEADGVVR